MRRQPNGTCCSMHPPSTLSNQKAKSPSFPGASKVPVPSLRAVLSAAFAAELSAAFVPRAGGLGEKREEQPPSSMPQGPLSFHGCSVSLACPSLPPFSSACPSHIHVFHGTCCSMHPPSTLSNQKAKSPSFPGASKVPVPSLRAVLSAAFAAELSAAFVPPGLPQGSQFKRQFKHFGTPVGGSISKVKWWSSQTPSRIEFSRKKTKSPAVCTTGGPLSSGPKL